MISKILHRYVIVNKIKKTKRSSDWIDVSSWTVKQIQEVSRRLDEDFPKSWYLEVQMVEE